MIFKKYFVPIFFILASILLLLFDRTKYYLVLLTGNRLGFKLAIGLLLNIMYVLYCGLVIWAVIYVLKRIKEKRLGAFVPLIIVTIILLIFFFIPYSKVYLNFDYEINKTNRSKTIEMFANKEIIKNYPDQEEYIAPYMFTSYTGKIYIQDVDGVTKVMFYSYLGFTKRRIIVYTSDDSGIDEYDFNFGISEKKLNLSDVKKLDKNWYSAITTP